MRDVSNFFHPKISSICLENRVLGMFIGICLIAAITSCNPKVSTSLTAYHTQERQASDIKVLHIGSDAPENVVKLGSVKVSEGGFTTNCDYDLVLFYARSVAAKKGADLIHVTAHQPPNYWSKCHQIEADLYVFSAEFVDTTLNTDQLMSARLREDFSGQQDSIVEIQGPVVDDKIFRIAFGGGKSWLLGEPTVQNDPAIQAHNEGLLTGTFINIEIGFAVHPNLTAGVRFDQMRSSNASMITTAPDEPGQLPETNIMSDDIRTTFAGPQIQWRKLSRKKRLEIMLGASIGYMGFRNDAVLRKRDLLITGYTLGMRTDINIDYRILPYLALTVQGGFAYGVLNSLTAENKLTGFTFPGAFGRSYGLTRGDLGAGIRFLF